MFLDTSYHAGKILWSYSLSMHVTLSLHASLVSRNKGDYKEQYIILFTHHK